MELQNTSGMSEEQFAAARDRLPPTLRQGTRTASVRPSELPDVASLKVDINQPRLAALGLSDGDVNTTISAAWGGRYVNDFIDRGRVKRVYVQGDPYRSEPSVSTNGSYATARGGMVPFSSFANVVEDDADQPVALPGLSFLRAAGTEGRRA